MENLLDALKDISLSKAPDLERPLGNMGDYIVAPKSEEEVSRILKFVHDTDQTLNILGGGTKQGFGGQRERADLLMTLSGYKGICEHSTGDMTMTVRAGTTIGDIKKMLAQKGQMVPVDPAWPDAATIGGVVAANESGPKRLAYGSARDFVIGLRVVYPDGRVIRTGGKVVKNVAGYDMNKLFIGSMGTLGVISEVTLKLRPLPQYESLIHLSFSGREMETIQAFVQDLLHSHMEPVAVEIINPSLNNELFQKDAYGLLIGFEDREKSVHTQQTWVNERRPMGTVSEIFKQQEAKKVWQRLSIAGPSGASELSDHRIAIKIGSPNKEVIPVLQACGERAEKWGVKVEAHGGLGTGVSKAFIEGHPEQLIAFITDIRAVVEKLSGYVICTHLPFWLRQKIEVWGHAPAHFFLLEGIKQAIDPKGFLNAGRFIGGI